MNSLNDVFHRLDIDKSKGLYYTNDGAWKNELRLPSRITRLLENSIKPDAFFCIDNKPLFLFFENPKDKNLHKKIWNFNESPIVIILRKGVVEIFNGFKYEKELNELAKIGDHEKLNDFTYFNLFINKTWECYQKDFEHKNRIDYFLLKNIKFARDKLKEKIEARIANALIGKCIFVCYLIDRKVFLKFEDKRKLWTKNDFCELLKNPQKTKKFFDYIKSTFNGDDIFALANKDYLCISKEILDVLIRLLNGEDLEKGQPSFFDLYDFSIIPIEFISNVYELFIGKNSQKEGGAYYTPLFLVDYILKETIEKHFEEKLETNNCVTLDPACGSGIFLIETLRRIIEQYRKNNYDKKLTSTILKNLTTKNIYGVDKDPNAIQIAMFSIYLTLLDYQEPANIETFKFPPLKNSNLFEADFFDTNINSFETKLKNIEFDYIIGNPPWKGGALGEYGKKYIKERQKKEKMTKKKYETAINNNEIVEGFVLRVSDFSMPNTKCALIVKSSILYNRGYNMDYSDFRRYWLEEFFINKIVEFAPVRREVFDKSNDKAIAPAAILFYQYAAMKNTDKNILEYIAIKPSRFFSYFKIFTINRSDNKEVEQQLLKKHDWLFKVLVYGSYLDFNLITHLKEDYCSVLEKISDKTKFIYGTGIQYSTNPVYDSKHLHNYPFIDAYAIEPYFIDPSKIGNFSKEKVHRLRNQKLFSAPMLLIRDGLDTKSLNAKAAISIKDSIFKHSVTSVKSFKNDKSILKTIMSIFSSSLYSYLAINTFSVIGIEREITRSNDKFSVPYIKIDVIELVNIIEKSKMELYNLKQQSTIQNDFEISKIQDKIKNAENEINKIILEKLNFNDLENSLLDYALNINRPLITRTQNDKYEILEKIQNPLPIYSEEIVDYAKIYLNRFKRNLDNNEQKFIVRIWHTNQLLGMFFEVVSINTLEENGIIWEKADNKKILSLIKLSSEKITDKLFMQKDIRGFEKKYFYIFKPNERQLWHKAIAYLDVDYFMDAILRAGSRGE